MQPWLWHAVALAALTGVPPEVPPRTPQANTRSQPLPRLAPPSPSPPSAAPLEVLPVEPQLVIPAPPLPIVPGADRSGAPSGAPGISEASQLEPAAIGQTERPLPINLATALRLADARPLIVEAARASLEVAAAQLERANVLWMPSLYAGIDYFRHDGGFQSPLTGNLVTNSRQQLLIGPGVAAVFPTTDAIFEPLATRRVMKSRVADVQAAKNDALLAVAEAYFTVQQSRGSLAGALDTVEKAQDLARRVKALGQGLVAPIEIDRALTTLAELEQVAVSAREDWRVSSARLTRVLRLDPGATVLPMEPPHLQLTLIDPRTDVDSLVPIGLTNRPELASRQALVQATLAKLKQERMRPLIPSVVVTGASGSNGPPLAGGYFAGAPDTRLNETSPRFDLTAQLLWELRNFGYGNQGLIRERQGQSHQALVDFLQTQDGIAEEVAESVAQLQSAATRVTQAEMNLKEGLISFAGNLKGMGETTRFGDVLNLVIRPQEAVAALQQLSTAYRNYFGTVADYNRAEFRLFHALGFPSEVLACQRPPGPIVPVDTRRPAPLPPVVAPEPCTTPVCMPPPTPPPGPPPAPPRRRFRLFQH